MQLRTLACLAPVVVALSSCSSFQGFGQKKNEGLGQVDELLARVEQLQVESVLCKETAHAAYGVLQTIVGPDFDGDAIGAHSELEKNVEASQQQAEKFAKSIAPLEQSADEVFERWTEDLEGFGNTKLRQQSQARLEETRARCDAVLRAARAADVAYEAFNADLKDHALFLEHDFNASSVASIASAVEGLQFQASELDRRLDACAAAAKTYVQAAALRGEVTAQPEEQPVAQAAKPATKSSTLRRKPAATEPVAKVEPAPSAPAPGDSVPPPAPDEQKPR